MKFEVDEDKKKITIKATDWYDSDDQQPIDYDVGFKLEFADRLNELFEGVEPHLSIENDSFHHEFGFQRYPDYVIVEGQDKIVYLYLDCSGFTVGHFADEKNGFQFTINNGFREEVEYFRTEYDDKVIMKPNFICLETIDNKVFAVYDLEWEVES